MKLFEYNISWGDNKLFGPQRHLWFRIFGRGLKIKYIPYHFLLFSERNGHHKGIIIGNWYIGILPKKR